MKALSVRHAKSPSNRNQKRPGFALIEPLEGRTFLSAAPPVALAPGNPASPGPVLTTLTPKFTWTPESGVSGYQIHIYDETKSIYLSENVGATATSYTPAPGTLLAGDDFVWNVRDIVGPTTGAPSNYLYFETPSLPAPTVTGPGSSVSPGPTLTTLTPTFTWHAVTSISGYTGYQINLYDITASKFSEFIVGATATSFTLPAGALTAGDSYVWNLRLRNGTQTGLESLPYLYFVAPPAASLPSPIVKGSGSTVAPGPTLTTLTPTFLWQAVTSVAGLTGYQINLYDITTKVFDSFKVGASVASYTLTPGILQAGDDYVWNVRVLTATQSGPPSAYLYFIA